MVKPYTQQEAFNKAYLGILSQGKPSVDKIGLCVYNGPNGVHCAIGWLIPPELYRTIFEGSLYFEEVIKLVPALKDLDLKFLTELRITHDISSRSLNFLEKFKLESKNFARKYNLTIPEVTGITE